MAKVKEILIAPKANASIMSLSQAQLDAGKGIVGDRYYSAQGTFSEHLKDLPDVELTLIEQEQIQRFNDITSLDYSGQDFRRNIVTEGIKLNELVDKTFSIGDVSCRGIRLCEPCGHLAKQLGSEILDHMIHRGGLRAQILSDGQIQLGDALTLTF
ncbi:MAG: MOSC domain-containing protein [Gammaproteobacteria bacterium]|nr:MOSC domain-containing protein [Gammaproteobacteria bacterium]